MSETRQLLEAWKSAVRDGEEYAIATVVRVQGSSYRKPGARMLLTRSGHRSGMVSGGCLEGEISRKIWWLTENGPSIQRYSTSFDEDGHPGYGLGCGGTVDVLLERSSTAEAVLEALRTSVEERTPSVVLTIVEYTSAELQTGTHMLFDGQHLQGSGLTAEGEEESFCLRVAEKTLQSRNSALHNFEHQAKHEHLARLESQAMHEHPARSLEVFAEYIAPPLGLFVFGAGDDAKPLVELAHMLGWHVTVADGRSNLVRAARFPLAEALAVLPAEGPVRHLAIGAYDAAVLLTHSYAQDLALLQALLPMNLGYLGVLGPRRRTQQLVEEAAGGIGLTAEECMASLHAPVGLDLGATSPTGIALSIVAEIQAAQTLQRIEVERTAAEAILS